MQLNLPKPIADIKLPNIPAKLTRAQLDKVLSAALMLNSVLAVVGVVLFFINCWWILPLMLTIGFPFLAGLALAYKYTRLREPIKRFAVKYVVKIYEGIVQSRAGLIKKVYTMACWCIPSAEWKHITWGYASLDKRGQILPNLTEAESEKRWYNQLYHYLATGMGNWNTLEGKNVLEIRSGGGAGLNYVAKYLNPERAVGIDMSNTQVNYNEENSNQKNIEFIAVDDIDKFALNPNLRDQTFDLVLTVQSTQFFNDFTSLLNEVGRVLKPGGIFAFADLRSSDDWGQLEGQLEGSPMRILRKENISKNVVQAIKLGEYEKFSTIHRRFGRFLDSGLRKIGLIKDNAIVETLNKGTVEAHAYVLRKADQTFVNAR